MGAQSHRSVLRVGNLVFNKQWPEFIFLVIDPPVLPLDDRVYAIAVIYNRNVCKQMYSLYAPSEVIA